MNVSTAAVGTSHRGALFTGETLASKSRPEVGIEVQLFAVADAIRFFESTSSVSATPGLLASYAQKERVNRVIGKIEGALHIITTLLKNEEHVRMVRDWLRPSDKSPERGSGPQVNGELGLLSKSGQEALTLAAQLLTLSDLWAAPLYSVAHQDAPTRALRSWILRGRSLLNIPNSAVRLSRLLVRIATPSDKKIRARVLMAAVVDEYCRQAQTLEVKYKAINEIAKSSHSKNQGIESYHVERVHEANTRFSQFHETVCKRLRYLGLAACANGRDSSAFTAMLEQHPRVGIAATKLLLAIVEATDEIAPLISNGLGAGMSTELVLLLHHAAAQDRKVA